MKTFFKIVCSALICGAIFVPATAFAEESTESTVTTETVSTTEIDVISEEKRIQPTTENGSFAEQTDIPKGNGSLIEDVSNDDVNRQFITVESKGGNVFYIIIDKDSNTENVYFLNAVDEYDLLAFAENFPENEDVKKAESTKSSSEENGGKTVKSEKDDAETTEEIDGENTTETPKNNSTTIVGIIAIAGIGGAVYFKVIKPKIGGKSAKTPVYDDEEEEDDEETVNEDEQEDD